MGAYWRRLLSCERRCERLIRLIKAQQNTITQLQQQLQQLRSRVS